MSKYINKHVLFFLENEKTEVIKVIEVIRERERERLRDKYIYYIELYSFLCFSNISKSHYFHYLYYFLPLICLISLYAV